MNVLLKNKIEKGISCYNFDAGLKIESFPIKERGELLEQSSRLNLSRKGVLYHEGESPKGIYILQKGKLKLSQLNMDGTEQILFIYSVGTALSHRPILGVDKQPVTATALEDCELIIIEKEHFLRVLNNSPELSRIVMQSISHEFTILIHRINMFAQRGIKERLALFLLMLNEIYRAPNQFHDQSEIVLNRNDLAAYVGTSVECLVRTLRIFKDNNYVKASGKSIFISDFETLLALSRV